ncbi:MAG: hypothetical protein JWR72_2804 [Flavisolibacter sp.]|nr:hypothetical protein [Flavisolibacter sp.]
MNNQPGEIKPTLQKTKFEMFAGSAACASCHKDIYEKHINTEHFLSTAPANEKNILGSFKKGENSFIYNDVSTVTMEKRDSGFYQVHYVNGKEVKKGRFDMVVGSGRKGQSYISTISNHFVQMPVTFFTAENQWSNSPGYPADKVVYNRPVTSRCLECHSTYAEKIPTGNRQIEEFNTAKIIYGIDCEKCHGAGAMHVQFQSENPTSKLAKFIVNPSKLSRQQNLDLCTLCHGGRLNKTRPSFSFQAGDTLLNYFSRDVVQMDASSIDVHGNQAGMLSASKCFQLSQLTCTSCHNTHENEKDKLVLFSQRCLNCHTQGHQKTCKLSASLGASIKQNCIDCHMPKQPSRSIAVYLQGASAPTSVLMRTHLIKPYPEETKKFIDTKSKK